MSCIVNEFRSNYKQKKPSYRWIKTQDLEYRNTLEKLFTGRSANGRHVESITTRQNELELSSDEEEISSRAGSAKFPKALISDSESDVNSAPPKGLDQEKTSRSTSSIWVKNGKLHKTMTSLNLYKEKTSK